jgi:hypothetical protein
VSTDPDLRRRNRRAVVWTLGGVAARYGAALLVVLGLLGLANRYPPADRSSLVSGARGAPTATERGGDRRVAPATEVTDLPDWVQRRRLQDAAAPWRLDNLGRVVWVRP